MNAQHREWISIALTLVILYMTYLIVYRFIPSMTWATMIVVTTYPLYRRFCRYVGGYSSLNALIATILVGMFLLIPLSWVVTILVKEMQLLVLYLQHINQHGGDVPAFLSTLPWVGTSIQHYWEQHFSKPGFLSDFLQHIHLTLAPFSYYAKQIGIDLAHRGIQLGFTLVSLFFFYRDGDKLSHQLDAVGRYCLGDRWSKYVDKLPEALRGTVNGTVLVGLGVGLLMGICYALVGFPAPTIFGFLTAIASMIPFAVPLVFLIVSFVLLVGQQLIGAIIVLIWGTIVMFIADHFVKPTLIGGAIQLPFLAVLFGILGGVETLGLLGLFLGPIVMVFFITLWYEMVSELDKSSVM